jgi:hypothetical protein
MEASLRHLGVAADHDQGGAAGNDALARAARSQRLESRPVWPLDQGNAEPHVHGPAVGPGEALVPNLLGRAARSAVVQARHGRFDVTLQGSGVVNAQSPAAGTIVARGTVLTLQLSAPTPELPAPPLGSDLAQVIPTATHAAEAVPAHELREVSLAESRGQDG